MTKPTRSIAVIGSGLAGLITAKELTERGFNVVVFEERSNIGGVFSSMYEGGMLTSSANITAFGCFPHGAEHKNKFWTGPEYLQYLIRFRDHFQLSKHIQYETRVTNATFEDGTWTLQTKHVSENSSTSKFDHLVICTGSNHWECIPQWASNNPFSGQVLHSSQFANAQNFKGKRVLIVGVGESGSDIAYLVAQQATQVCISSRNGPGYIVPRYASSDLTSDTDTNRAHHGIDRLFLARYGFFRKIKLALESFLLPSEDPDVDSLATRLNSSHNLHPFHRFGTKNTSFVKAVVHLGSIYKNSDVVSLDKNGAVFADGSRFDCDAVILCTGYRIAFPFLTKSHPEAASTLTNLRMMWKKMFLPEFGNALSFVGFARPGFGAVPPLAELQARYLALVLDNERELPTPQEMVEQASSDEQQEFNNFPVDARRITSLTDYMPYLTTMANLIGCQPALVRMFFLQPRTWYSIMFAPLSGAQFRLVGPGSNPTNATSVLKRYTTMPFLVCMWELSWFLCCWVWTKLSRSHDQPQKSFR